MGRKNRERIERINKGLERPRSVTHPNTGEPAPKMILVAKSQVGREQRRQYERLAKVYQRKEEVAKARKECDKVKKLTLFGALSPLP